MVTKENEMLPLELAAADTDYSPETLRKAAQAGRLNARKMGRNWFTTPEDLQRWLNDPSVHRSGPKRKVSRKSAI